MIKNKTLRIKIIFKIYLNILKKLGFQTDFCSIKHHKIILKYCIYF